MKKLLILGGTGLIGRAFISAYRNQYAITVASRNPARAARKLNLPALALHALKTLDDFDVVLNLAGENIAAKRWNAKQKERIINSRLAVIDRLHTAAARTTKGPAKIIISSAIGYYGTDASRSFTEQDRVTADDFPHQVCAAVEHAAAPLAENSALTILRTGLVLSPKGGVLKKMLPAFWCGAGGKVGSGRQMMSWIHIGDMVRAIDHIINHDGLTGPVNITAPHPASNDTFGRSLATTLHRPYVCHLPTKLVQVLFGEMAELLLTGQKVLPERLVQSGFTYHFPELDSAFKDLLS